MQKNVHKKRIVVMGGGNGTATVLRALKRNYELFDIAAVITMSDSGGSSGRLRQEFNTLPAGDIMRAVCALTKYNYKEILKPMFYQTRFTGVGKLAGHNLGNLFLILSAQYAGDFMAAVRALEQAVGAKGTVYPTTLDLTNLMAELDNGDLIRTEAEIDRPTYDRSLKIKRVWLEPTGQAYPGTIQLIEEADCIILGPGSLYCSVIAALLPTGILEAMARSQARLIHIASNKYELDGETGPIELCDALWTLESYLPRTVDTVIFNKVVFNEDQRRYYAEKRWALTKYNPEQLHQSKVIGRAFERSTGGLSAERLSYILYEEIMMPNNDHELN